jgi:peptide/nickel transport system ATP-binding protein
MGEATPVLDIIDLCIDFRTRAGLVRAVDRLSFSIGAGEILGLVGESGSGKTISMLASVGLINDPNAIVSGSIRYKGRELLGLDARALQALRGRDIAMIFQDPMTAMTPVHTIGWQIVEQIQAHEKGIPSPALQFHRYPHQLSGGMRQRAMIAMALSCDPALLIADEPTTALDVTVQAQILVLLDGLREKFGSSIILITHDMGVVAEIADRVMVMYAGRLVERGTAKALFAQPIHPYTQGLLAAIPSIDGPLPRRLAAIPGAPPSPAELPLGCPFAPRCSFRFAPCGERPMLTAQARHEVACFLASGPPA